MKILVLGATSAIAQAAARVWAQRGEELFLVARNGQRLSAVADDLRARGAKVLTLAQDLNDDQLHEPMIENAIMAMGAIDVVLLAQAVSGDRESRDADPELAELILRTNLVAPVRLLTLLAPRMRQGSCIAALSSVAGERGRAAVGVYGASKAGLDSFLSALRQRLSRRGVRVLTLKPGFVDTPMTANLKKTILFSSAARVGRGVVRAVDKGREVAFLPWWWRWVMFVIRALPERVFKKLSF
jgi:decaprenylphospho-beta-D-erythro-pentofuranosid-2-ulose 2-reductase